MKKILDVNITVVTLRDRASSEDDVKNLWRMMGCAAIHMYKKYPNMLILSGIWPPEKIEAVLADDKFDCTTTTWDDLELQAKINF